MAHPAFVMRDPEAQPGTDLALASEAHHRPSCVGCERRPAVIDGQCGACWVASAQTIEPMRLATRQPAR
jgi:hypothetical protein